MWLLSIKTLCCACFKEKEKTIFYQFVWGSRGLAGFYFWQKQLQRVVQLAPLLPPTLLSSLLWRLSQLNFGRRAGCLPFHLNCLNLKFTQVVVVVVDIVVKLQTKWASCGVSFNVLPLPRQRRNKLKQSTLNNRRAKYQCLLNLVNLDSLRHCDKNMSWTKTKQAICPYIYSQVALVDNQCPFTLTKPSVKNCSVSCCSFVGISTNKDSTKLYTHVNLSFTHIYDVLALCLLKKNFKNVPLRNDWVLSNVVKM